jgi:hypothetical protein
MSARSIFTVLTAVLVLAGCGASHHPKPSIGAALAATIRSGSDLETGATASCLGPACTIKWHDGLDSSNGLKVALSTLVSVEEDDQLHAMRDLKVRIEDDRSRRVAVFTCDLRHRSRLDAGGSDSLLHALGCVEADRRLA